MNNEDNSDQPTLTLPREQAHAGELLPLTPNQEVIWYEQKLFPDSAIYNTGGYTIIRGPIEEETLKRALAMVIDCNDALRTQFHEKDGQPFQEFWPVFPYDAESIDFSDQEFPEESCLQWMDEQFKESFHLNHPPLFQVAIIKASEHLYYLFARFHHIIIDGWGAILFFKTIEQYYNSLLANQVPDECYSYLQYVRGQMDYIGSKKYEEDRAFWNDMFTPPPEPLLTPRDGAAAFEGPIPSNRETIDMDRELFNRLGTLAKQYKIQLFYMFTGILYLYMSRIHGKPDMVMASPISNRKGKIEKETIGMFTGVSPLRINVEGSITLGGLFHLIGSDLRKSYRHQKFPINQINKNIGRIDLNRRQFHDITLSYIPHSITMQFGHSDADPLTSLSSGFQQIPLSVEVDEFSKTEDSITVHFEYLVDYLDADEASSIARHFIFLLQTIEENINTPIKDIEIVTPDEKKLLLETFNDTQASNPTDQTIIDLFERQVRKHPGRIALITTLDTTGQSLRGSNIIYLSYGELNALADSAARQLADQGVQPGTIVALLAQPGIEMMGALLGILKAGAAYLPINPEYPEERIDYMLADSAAVLFTPDFSFNSLTAPLPQSPIDKKSRPVSPGDPAYVIYTSGSTGRPKGCIVTHSNVVRLMVNDASTFDFNEGDGWVMAHSFAFDFSVWEMYGALLYGAFLLLPQRQNVRDTGVFLELLKTFGITVLNQTPGAFYQLMQEESTRRLGLNLRYIIFGGEKLEPARLKPWTDIYPPDQVSLINMYGITENTVHTTFYRVSSDDIDAPESLSPIGKPLPGVKIYIWDDSHRLLPIGAAGEMALSGDGLSPGYLNRPELTSQRFVHTAVEANEQAPPNSAGQLETVYLSGDIARWTKDGNLQYLGRKDRQVKIRGHRIETGEIEYYLLNHPAIADAVVMDRTSAGGEKELAAYVVFSEEDGQEVPAVKDLRIFLGKLLPDYMTPSFFLALPSIPLTVNGKTDYRALSQMAGESLETGTGYIAPQSETESRLALIWKRVLSCEKVGIHDNFFDLGGHSLTATRASSLIQKELGIDTGLRDMFTFPTVAQMAEYIDGKRQVPSASIQAVAKREYYELSPGQRRLWMLDRLEGPGISYNIPLFLELSGPLDIARLESAVAALIQRHESLRTSFHMIDGQPVQRIHDHVDWAINLGSSDEPLIQTQPQHLPFDLGKAPLIRVELYPQSEDLHLLLIEMHHIITDAWSIHVLFRELQQLYAEPHSSLAPLTVQYKDYTYWLKDKLASPEGETQAHYWKNQFDSTDGLPPALELPVDFHRPTTRTSEGSIFEQAMGRPVSMRLEQFCGGREVTPFMTLLAAAAVMLRYYTLQEDIVIGTPIAGRSHMDLEHQVGFYINTLPMRCRPQGDLSFETFLNDIRQLTLDAYQNQLYPFDRLVDELKLEREAGRTPLFDVMVAMQTTGPRVPELHLKGLEARTVDIPYTISKFDLTFEFIPADAEQGMMIQIEYNTRLYVKESIQRMSSHFIQLLENIFAEPASPIRQLDIVTADERHRLLVEFNSRSRQYSNDATLDGLFASQAEKLPDNPALVYTPSMSETTAQTLSYGQLHDRSSVLAAHLSKQGLKPGKIAGIIAKSSLEQIIAILAVLKTGAAYLPINPGLPPARVSYILNDSGAAMVLCSAEYVNAAVEATQWTIIDIEDKKYYEGVKIQDILPRSPEDLAYIIYTSGSTGSPKGVPITHSNTSPLFQWLPEYLNFTPSDRSINNLSYYFDGGIWELFLTLVSGAAYYITSDDITLNPSLYIDFMNRHQISYLDITPTKLEFLINEQKPMKTLRYLCVAAERFMLKLINACLPLLNGDCRIINMYGPTETTILSACYRLEPEDFPGLKERVLSLPIGKPLANDLVAVLNPEMKPCPIGVKGELYIGGDGLTKGYINDPEKTAATFVPNPIAELNSDFLYKTSDQVVWLPDGNIEFLGRFDHQIKIRGLRVELGELEHILDTHPQVRQSVVIAREVNGQSELVAYFVAADPGRQQEITVGSLRNHLGKHLPMYMIPAYFVPLEAIPVNPNGKTDRRRLPDPLTLALGNAAHFIAPQNEIEEQLIGIWKILLNRTIISIDDNFFESGGNSLKMIQASGMMSKTFGKHIPITWMMEFPTIRSFARHLLKEQSGILTERTDEPPAGQMETQTPAAPVNRDIAVIGMACRFPGAPNIDAFWENLKNGVESVSFYETSELAAAGVDQTTFEDPGFVRARGGVLEGKEYFDALFFDYLPSEAAMMDPQVRVFHQCAWTALEHAGYGPGTIQGDTGIWAGAAPSTGWEILTLLSGQRHVLGEFASHNLASSQFLTTRVSYKLNLKGPAINVQTACSTSLTAIQMARLSLLNGHCDMALAGGVSIPVYNINGYMYNEEMIFSNDGHCRAFDAASSGTINGEGAGVVVLKRLDRALADGDTIHAVIKGGALNNDGDEKPGYEAPGIKGQVRVIAAALKDAQIEPASIGYIETHGTGTPLGDPIEIAALNQVFKPVTRDKDGTIAIGSLKTNVGHMDAAAGVGGFIKAVLTLKHNLLPPSLHYQVPNPKIDFEGGPFYVNTTLKPWPANMDGTPRRAGISSFGIGGTNAHIIVEEAPQQPPQPPEILEGDRRYRLLRLSARSESALDTLTDRLAAFLSQHPGSDIGDVAYTLSVGRKLMPYRQSVVVQDIAHALACLSDPASCSVRRLYSQQEPMDIVFMFPGQGSQYTNMARDLYRTEPVFAECVDQCFDILKSQTDVDLKSILYPGSQDTPGINQTGITQPILFTVEYALARLLMAWGIQPHAMLGYSLGEYVAAQLAGVMSLEDALKLVSIRGRVVEKVPPGALLSVPATWKEIQAMLTEFALSYGTEAQIGLAADNGDSCIISGTDQVITAFEKKMRKKIFAAVRIQASHAIHSPMMEPVVEEFETAVREITLHPPTLPFLSNITGDWITGAEATDPAYWSKHLLSPVQFDKSIIHLLKKEKVVFLEAGPGNAVSSLILRRKDVSEKHIIVHMTRLPQEEVPDDEFLLGKLAYLEMCGLTIDWHAYYASEQHRRLPLPGYPFEGRKYWFSGDPFNIAAGKPAGVQAEVQSQVQSEVQVPEQAVPSQRFSRTPSGVPYVAPQTETEIKLGRIIEEFMGIHSIGINDNFFELGGDSLKLMTISLKVHKQMGVKLPVAEYFSHPTIKELASYIDSLEPQEAAFRPIPPLEARSSYAVSNSQRRMWVLHQFSEQQSGYNMPAAFTMDSGQQEQDLNIDGLIAGFNSLIERHEILRTGFKMMDGELRQVVYSPAQTDFVIEQEDLTPAEAADNLPMDSTDNETGQALAEMIRSYATALFNLEQPPLFRMKIIKLRTGRWILLFNMHHIISDGWSMNVFISELTQIYNDYIAGQPTELAPLTIQYKDYAAWRNEFLKSEEAEQLKLYWLEQLTAPLPVLDLPADYPRPAFKSYDGARLRCQWRDEQAAAIGELAKAQDATLFMVLLAAVHVLLYRYSGQDEIITGSPVAGRNHPDLENQIGLYMNMLPLRLKANACEGFDAFLEQVKQTASAAYDHEVYPFDLVVDELDLERDTSRHPLFDVAVILQNTPRTGLELQGIHITRLEESLQYVSSPYDITFNFEEHENRIALDIEYCTALFTKNRIQRMWTHLDQLMRHIVEQPGHPLHSLGLLTEEEQRQVLYEFNDTALDYPGEKSVIDVFREQAARTPDKTAITGLDDHGSYWSYLSYAVVDQLTDELAALYHKQGIRPGAIVPLKIERSIEIIMHILAILKIGAAYLPIDPSYPEERIQYILNDSQAAAVDNPALFGSLLRQKDSGSSGKMPDMAIKPESLAYVTYTSGSTGKPKGVMIEHGNILSFIQNLTHIIALRTDERIYALTTFTFDLAVFELLGSLLTGSTIVMESNPEDQDVIVQNVRTQAVTVVQITPSRLTFLLDTIGPAFLSTVRLLLVGGEAIPQALWQTLAGLTHLRAYNVYGPSEATIWSSTAKIEGESPTIGKPLLNQSIYILSTAGQLVPVGIAGEIHIGGHGVGRGYLNRPELTAERFIQTGPDSSQFLPGVPGSSSSIEKGNRSGPECIYKTGDLGAWNTDGSITFLGRIDWQVKLRGFRIELEEIEYYLSMVPGIRDAAVIVTAVNGEDQLAAFVSGDIQADEKTLNGIKEHVSTFLPDYMIPHHYVVLDRLPVTSSGKTDRKALARLEVSARDSEHLAAAPRSQTEKTLTAIWQEILRQDHIGIEDNFFRLGGHSLLATRIVSAIHKQLSVQISLRDIFKHPDIARLARLVDEGLKEKTLDHFEDIPAAEKRQYYPLSHAQRRLWVLNQFSHERISYNIPSAFTIKGDLNIETLNQAFIVLVQRHDSLRTSFITVQGEPVQVIHDAPDDALALEQIEKDRIEQRLIDHASTPFDLSRAPLFDACVLQVSSDEHILLFNIHHIVCDGWSMGVLVREMTRIYAQLTTGGQTDHQAGRSLPRLAIQYKDFVLWQNRRLSENEDAMSTMKRWWHNQFTPGNEIPVLDLPVDFTRPAVKQYNGDVMEFELNPWLTRELYQLSHYHDCTLFMTLLAAVHVLLYRYTGQEDMVIGSPVAGRDHPQLEDQIGFYVNTLALRNRIHPNDSFGQFLGRVKQTISAAFENSGYPFDRLVDELELERDTSRHPLFDVMVILQNVDIKPFQLPELDIEPLDIPFHTSKFDIMFSFFESSQPGGALRASIEYDTSLFKPQRINRLWQHFTRIAAGIAGSFNDTAGSIEILPGAERQQLLERFNDTGVDYPPEHTLLHIFNQQVQRRPDAAAVAFNADNTDSDISDWSYLSYKELDQRSTRLARHLNRHFGVQPGDIVAIRADRHPFVLDALLAVLKLGAIYLPIDPAFPQERIDYILADSQPKTFIQPELAIKEENKKEIETGIEKDIDNEIAKERNRPAESAAYIIYTSGSTGKPKGVLGTLACLTNLIHWQRDTLDINVSDEGKSSGMRSILYSALNFDVSIQEMMFSVCTGGLLFIISDEIKRDPMRLTALISEQEIQLITLPFSALNLLFHDNSEIAKAVSLKHIITSGEQLQISPALAGFLEARSDVILHNQYGPSETHVVTSYSLSGAQNETDLRPPIGKPVANTACYILDSNLHLVPIGIPGELYLGGIHLAQGYLNNPELTAQRFIALPLTGKTEYLNTPSAKSSITDASPTPVDGDIGESGSQQVLRGAVEYVYKTGDLASWLDDGNIKFLGRRDQQVKIRGFRVEPEEIERHLLTHDMVSEAVVLTDTDNEGVNVLTAAVVPISAISAISGAAVTETSLRDHLIRFLPEYMIPSVFRLFEEFPRTASGKTDKRQLLRLTSTAAKPETGSDYIGPQTEIEKGLVRIWQEVLDRDNIGIHDHFFHIGGHSLKATQVVSRIHRELSLNIELHDIFTTPTIAGLAKLAGDTGRAMAAEETARVTIEPAAEQAYYETSHAQKRLWVIHRMEENLTAYNIPMALELQGDIDTPAFIHALETIVRRHDTLRTTFTAVDGQPKQMIHAYETCGFKVDTLDFREREDKEQKVRQMAVEDAVKPFDLEKGPLIRAQWIHMDDRRYVLLLNLHHIIADGWSTQVMRHELYTLYEAYAQGLDNPLPPLRIQYKDFAAWQNRNISEEDEHYWMNKLTAPLSLVNFIYDFPKDDFNAFEGKMERRTLPVSLTQRLKDIARANDVTLSSVILAVYNIFLSQLTGQTDILIASSIANRVNPDIEKLIGFFVNMLIIRSNLSGDLSFEEFLKQVHQTQLEAFTHQDYPFDLLVDKLNPSRQTNYQPLFNVGFAFQNFRDVTIQLGMGQDKGKPDFNAFEVNVLHEEANHFTSLFDIVFFNAMNEGKLEMTMEYNSRLFKQETISGYLDDIEQFLYTITEQSENKDS